MLIHDLLDNGIEVLLKENHFSNLVALQCWVRAGSINEKVNERGIAHLIEHMLFKGTAKRKVGEIARTVEACGGEINAYTTFDRTVYYLTISSKHIEKGVDLLSDAIFNSAFDTDELKKEKEVVCEEIKRSNDNPSSQIGRKIFEQAFRGTEASRPIIGYEKEIQGFTREDLLNFHQTWYQSANMSVVAVGDFDASKAYDLINSYFGKKKKESLPVLASTTRQFPQDIHVELIKGDFAQPRLEIGFEAPGLEHFDVVGLDLAAFALGSGESSRFSRTIRDKEGLVSSVGASLYAPKFGGIFELSALPVLDKYLECLTSIARELMKLKYEEPVSFEELEKAKANFKADRIFQEETLNGQARILGYGLTTAYKHLFEDIYMTMVEKISSSAVHGSINRWINESRAIIVGLVPNESELTAEDLKKAYLKGVEKGKGKEQKLQFKRSSQGKKEDLTPHVFEINSGLKLIYRQNPNCELFNLIAATEGGLRGEGAVNVGQNYAISGLLGKATKSLSYEKFLAVVEGVGAGIDGFSGKDSLGLKLECIREKAKDLLKIFAESLLTPVFPKEQWESLKREVLQEIKAQDDLPSNVCVRRFQQLLFGEHPYKYPLYGIKESISEFNEKNLLEKFVKYRDEGPWVLGCVSSFEPQEVVDLLKENFSSWVPKKEKRKISPSNEKKEHLKIDHIQKDREQTHIIVGHPGITWGDKDRAALDVLTNILGGQGGRFFTTLRDKQSLAYTVAPLVTFGCDPGAAAAYIACAPSKKEEALAGLRREFDRCIKEKPTKDEVERSQNYIVGSHYLDMQHSESQAMTMALMELYGIGYDDFLKYPGKIESVKPDDLTRVSKRIFDPEKQIQVSVGNSD